jgi:CPA1 family monovalent cation:H+ antiporter
LTLFALLSVIVCLAALFGLVSHRFLRLPPTIGTLALSVIAVSVLTILGKHLPGIQHFATQLVQSIDFNAVVLHGMLAFLLFAGALHLDLGRLKKQAVPVAALSVVGTILATLFVAGLLWLILRLCHIPADIPTCLIFGALISPTDPVAVLEMLRRVKAPVEVQTLLGGESLFNDGVGAVLFLALLEASGPHGMPSFSRFSILFLLEAGGGLALGLVAGYAVSRLIRLSDDYTLRTLLTLALAMGGYALADALHLSAPLEAVAAGLMVNYRARAVSTPARQHVADFWALLDDMLNVVLFLLLGFAMILVPFSTRLFVAGLLTIPAVLLARAASVAVVLFPLRRYVDRFGALCAVLTWGGLRGALSVALVLALTHRAGAIELLSITYTVVVFSVLAQGLTMVPLLRRLGYARAQV